METFFWEQTTCTINLKINENSVELIHISKVVIVFNYARKRFYCWPVHEDCGILLLIFWAVKKLDFRKTFFFKSPSSIQFKYEKGDRNAILKVNVTVQAIEKFNCCHLHRVDPLHEYRETLERQAYVLEATVLRWN